MTEPQLQDGIKKIASGVPFSYELASDGSVKNVTYQNTWKTGGTTPVEDEDGNVVDYKEDYTDHKLSDKQRSDLDAFIKTIE